MWYISFTVFSLISPLWSTVFCWQFPVVGRNVKGFRVSSVCVFGMEQIPGNSTIVQQLNVDEPQRGRHLALTKIRSQHLVQTRTMESGTLSFHVTTRRRLKHAVWNALSLSFCVTSNCHDSNPYKRLLWTQAACSFAMTWPGNGGLVQHYFISISNRSFLEMLETGVWVLHFSSGYWPCMPRTCIANNRWCWCLMDFWHSWSGTGSLLGWWWIQIVQHKSII